MRTDLTLQQLRAVVAVHDAGSFTAAAEALRVAQSSLSRVVAEVERRVATPLFARTTRRLEPTAAGSEFVAAARRAIGAVDAEMRHVEGFLVGRAGRVRIATLPSLAAILLPGVVSTFRRDRPEVALSIEDALSAEVLQRVRSGTADLAVTVVSAVPDPLDDLVVTPVATDRFCCVFPPTHRFAGRASAAWTELAGEPFIAFDRTTSIRQHVDASLAAAAVVPRQVLTARNIAAVAGLIAADLGVSVVPGLVLPLMGFAGVGHVVLGEPAAHRRIAVVRTGARPLPPAAAAFVELLTDPTGERPGLPEQASWVIPAATNGTLVG
ncbi:LysR family transcriptional regulator [Pseudonocardia sp. MH-G8]|uniref:LysR family transcriptional regulator n=1 Tax=Pseudonocardia sp. MH-G8 TaxID=1854588 RepID=UPI000B9FB3DD|nr:LysR family transcriptional regulator [Pseudonocardia sp. MH-G8]OZM78512.1 LysR family transcriptional regulator [Pseudonocardia sp. MH-G8]